jgi:hypothetical protein
LIGEAAGIGPGFGGSDSALLTEEAHETHHDIEVSSTVMVQNCEMEHLDNDRDTCRDTDMGMAAVSEIIVRTFI